MFRISPSSQPEAAGKGGGGAGGAAFFDLPWPCGIGSLIGPPLRAHLRDQGFLLRVPLRGSSKGQAQGL